MISEFQDLSDKITKLAELTDSLRRENAELRQSNAELRQSNATLRKANLEYTARFAQAKQRLQTLVGKLPADARAAAAAAEVGETKPEASRQEGGEA